MQWQPRTFNCFFFFLSMRYLFQCISSVQFNSVQSLSRVWLFVTPWIAVPQASQSITNPRSSLRLTSIESVMPSSHLILCHPLLLLPPIPPSIRVFFQWVNSSHEVAKVLGSLSWSPDKHRNRPRNKMIHLSKAMKAMRRKTKEQSKERPWLSGEWRHKQG